MTMQKRDTFIYKQEKFGGIRYSTPIPFNPRDYGLLPLPYDTSCRRGYYCDYEITDNGLFLQNLYTSSWHENYPDLCGVSVSPVEYVEEPCLISTEDGEDKWILEKTEKYGGYRLYANVHIPVSYTGRILGVHGFARDFSFYHYRKEFMYEVVKEFVIEDGRLVRIIDHSESARKKREEIKKNDPDWRYPLRKFLK